MKFKSSDYNDYNKKLGLYRYKYLDKLLCLLYRLREQYNIYDKKLKYWESDTGNQAEFLPSMYMDLEERILIHQYFFKELYPLRHKNKNRQLKIW